MQATQVKKSSQQGGSLAPSARLTQAVPRLIGVIGSRSLSITRASKVGEVTQSLLERGNSIASGGAIGADEFCLSRVVRLGYSQRAQVFSAWSSYAGFPQKVRAQVRQFREFGGSIVWGLGRPEQSHPEVRVALLQRNERLTKACFGLVAFIEPGSRGSIYTIKKTVRFRKPLVVFPFDCELPSFDCVKWKKLNSGGCWEGGYKAIYTD